MTHTWILPPFPCSAQAANAAHLRDPGIRAREQRTKRAVDGMSAALLARGRGQAPKPRSGASKTPGLRSAPGQKTMEPAVPLLPLAMLHGAAVVATAGSVAATPDTGPRHAAEACTVSNASGAR